MATTENSSFITGASIGILAAMASSKINKPSKNGRVNYKKLETDAQLIAQAILGEELLDGKEAIEQYIKTMQDDVFNENTTFADLVNAIDEAIEIKQKSIDDAVAKAEESMSPDIVSLNHIHEHTNTLGDIVASWAELEYEHKRQIAAMKRPAYKSALKEARANGIKLGLYDEDGKFSEEYMKQFTEPIQERKRAALEEFAKMDDPNWNPRVDEKEICGADEDENAGTGETSRTSLEMTIPMIDIDAKESHVPDTSGIDVLVIDAAGEEGNEPYDETSDARISAANADDYVDAAAETVIIGAPIVGSKNTEVPAEHGVSDNADDEREGHKDDFAVADDMYETDTGKIDIEPITEVVENIISDDSDHSGDTAPIVMEPEAIVEEVVAVAQEISEDTPAEVENAVVEIVEEMEAVAEMDIEECESFTDRFMAVNVDGAEDEKTDKDDMAAAIAELYDEEASDGDTIVMKPIASSAADEVTDETKDDADTATQASDDELDVDDDPADDLEELRENAKRRREEVGKFISRDES